MENKSHKESWYQARIIRWLRETYPRAFVWKAAAGPYCRQGIPDICMVLGGRFYGFEVKRPGGRPTKIQEQTIKEITAAGGIAGVVSYLEDVERMINSPSNDPLTLEELREMDGEPVFCFSKRAAEDSAYGIACIRDNAPYVRTIQNKGTSSRFFYLTTYGTAWLAYRQKPEVQDL